VQAAVNAKLIAAAVPNMAARHQRGPRRASRTAIVMATMQAPPVTPHAHGGGVSVPSTGSAKYRKPARPPVRQMAPIHSRRPMENPNQAASTTTRNTSSVTRIGWTSDNRPRCRATAWSRNEMIIRPKPASQILRCSAYRIRLNRSVVSAGASSMPLRWNTLVRAFAKAAPKAKMNTIRDRSRPQETYVSYS
jgi:hypothetical protein